MMYRKNWRDVFFFRKSTYTGPALFRCMITLFVGLGLQSANGADTLVVDGPVWRTELVPYARLFIDPGGALTMEEILRSDLHFSDSFEVLQYPDFPEAHWLHIPVVVHEELVDARIVVPGDSLMDYINHRLDYLDLFVVDTANRIWRHERSGFLVPKSQKSFQSDNFSMVAPISLNRGDRFDLYLRLQNSHQPQELFLGLELRHPEAGLPALNPQDRWLMLASWGMFIIIGLYVLVFFFFVRDWAFLYFGLFCLLYALDLFTPSGSLIYFLPENPERYHLLWSLSLISIPFLLLFGNTFVGIRTNVAPWWRYYQLVTVVFFAVTVYYCLHSLWEPHLIYPRGFNWAVLLLIPICLRFGTIKFWPAQLFAWGLGSFVGGNMIGVIAMMYGQTWGHYSWALGQIALLFIFAIGLGYRFLESEREQLKAEKLREVDALKSRFFTNITHEFRTPLSLILNPLQQVEASIPYPELANPQNELSVSVGQIQVMKRNALRLQQLIDQILDLSRLEAKRLSLQIEQGGILAFIRSRVSEFYDIARQKDIHLVANYGAENDQAWFDRDKLEKILVNIVANAIKYSPVNGNVHIQASTSTYDLTLSISNTGPGMSPEESERIFDRFYQADNAVRQGSGIGLALVKELVELHHGQIFVESRLNSGTTITLQLAIHQTSFSVDDFAAEAVQQPMTNGQHSFSAPVRADDPPLKDGNDQAPMILIVEDNADLQHFLQHLLARTYRVITADDGRSGEELATKYLPDVIISDVMMPYVTGIELCNRLKEHEKTCHIPLLLLTAKSTRKDRLEGLETGADDYLVKPFDAKELELKIQNLIWRQHVLKEKYGRQPWKLAKQEVNSLDEQFLHQVTTTISENLSNEDFSVEVLGRRLGYSRSQLFRKLKALIDRSPLDLIKEQRLHYAKDLLTNKALTVSEAAYEVGYSNVSYFSQSFKKEFGMTPSELLK